LKDGSELAEVTMGGRLPHARGCNSECPVADGA